MTHPAYKLPNGQGTLTLVSHHLCPYVQRAAISLGEKDVSFERRWIDLSDKPNWFTSLSPLGKVPLLFVGSGVQASDTLSTDHGVAIFESNVILEYLEETQPHPLHPADPEERARHRAWIEFGSAVLNAIGKLYNAPAAAALEAQATQISELFDRLETELAQRAPAWGGPYFAGEQFSLVDAVFGPVFRYFDTFEDAANLHMLERHPNVMRWRWALSQRASVRDAIDAGYPERLTAFLRKKGTAISSRLVP